MSKHYHKSSIQKAAQLDVYELLARIQAFVAGCRRPAVLEAGERELALTPGSFSIELRGGRLWVEAWNSSDQLSRRILAIEDSRPGVLDCSIHRFGGKPGRLTFLDLDRPVAAHRRTSGARQNFAEQFRRMLARQLPGWEVDTLSAGMDLQRSFSPVFPRARLSRGNRIVTALACPILQEEPAFLTFALIWHRYVSAAVQDGAQIPLILFLPEEAGNLTAHRLRWLRQDLLATRLFRFNSHGSAGEVDGQDLGNLSTGLNPGLQPAARPPDAEPLLREFLNSPERCLESVVRSHLTGVDSGLLPHPVYRQVLTFAGGDRDLVDLLVQCTDGRLAVLELKASEDIHLPIQALDYWMRVKWHSERNELNALFPQNLVPKVPPKLFLVAPAMSFHPANTTVLRYFLPSIEVERVGVNLEWQHEFRVILRLKGADVPMSHGSNRWEYKD